MSIKIVATAVAIVVFGVLSLATAKTLVGGNCSYEKFDGVCEKEKDEAGLFRFGGTVNGKNIVLTHNKLGSGEILKDKVACTLQFIQTGTCTPCIFSVGECGKDAWDLFRKSEK